MQYWVWWKRSHIAVYPCNVTITTCSYATQFQTKKKPYLWLRHTKYLNSSNFYKFIYWHIWSNRLASFFMEYFVVCVVYSVLQPVFHSWFENFASWHYLCEWGCFGNRVSSEALLLLCVRNAPQFIRPMKKKQYEKHKFPLPCWPGLVKVSEYKIAHIDFPLLEHFLMEWGILNCSSLLHCVVK